MSKNRYLFVAVLAAACLAGAALPSFAQFDTATVVGTVKDNTGGVVPGATVTLTNLDTGVATVRVTEANGSFEFMTVRIGRYKVAAELQGFCDGRRRQHPGRRSAPASAWTCSCRPAR